MINVDVDCLWIRVMELLLGLDGVQCKYGLIRSMATFLLLCFQNVALYNTWCSSVTTGYSKNKLIITIIIVI